MNKITSWLINPPTDGPKSILLLRLMVGGVFFWDGMLKFVYANQGVGRFTKLGIPFPHFTATFIGGLGLKIPRPAAPNPFCSKNRSFQGIFWEPFQLYMVKEATLRETLHFASTLHAV